MNLRESRRFPLWLGVLLAIAVTTTMDATGYSMLSALPLFPLLLAFWWWQGFSRTDLGFRWGAGHHYVAAVAYPVLVIPPLVLIAFAAGAIDTTETNWNEFAINLVVGGISTIVVGLITEEGFFRGWLWAGLERIGSSPRRVLLVTALAFVAWHLSAVTLDTGFDLPAWQIPIYVVNVFLMGLAWGLLRLASGSIVVASVSHGVWNGMAYSLFGFGEQVGALGIEATWIHSPESGVLGILLNAIFVVAFWRRVLRRPDVGRHGSGGDGGAPG